jgi:SNF2 family DNA or RNA helicase
MADENRIRQLANDIALVATAEGFAITGSLPDLSWVTRAFWKKLSGLTADGRRFAELVEQLADLELLSLGRDAITISVAQWYEIQEKEIRLFERSLEKFPFSLSLTSTGSPGRTDFKVGLDASYGTQRVFPRRVGLVAFHLNNAYELPQNYFELYTLVTNFNSLPDASKTKDEAYSTIGKVKVLCGQGGVTVDEFLRLQSVVLPQRAKIGISLDKAGRATFYPLFDGVDEDKLRAAFVSLESIPAVIDLDDGSGGRVRIVLPPDAQRALQDIQRVRHLSGRERDEVLNNPAACFTEGQAHEFLDFEAFSERVRGVTDNPLPIQVAVEKSKANWFGTGEALKGAPCIVARDDEGKKVITFRDKKEFDAFTAAAKDAHSSGSGRLTWKDHNLKIDGEFIEGLTELSEVKRTADEANSGSTSTHTKPDSGNDTEASSRGFRYLRVLLNDESAEYQEGESTFHAEEIQPISIPTSLKPEIELKPHQVEGITWLQNLFIHRAERRGCILADDMGLGKTLQILTFLAWAIEKGCPEKFEDGNLKGEPILVVCPQILLDVWKDEISRFFRGDTFFPFVRLHGPELKQFIRAGASSGRENKLGHATLDLTKLRQNRLVITNYDTVKNYQHSFARVPWSIVVVDEAQEIKDPNFTSVALKGVKAEFKVVATGTPVENSLMNLWNLLDFAQPGSILGSAKEFRDSYVNKFSEKSESDRATLVAELRTRLRYGRPDSFVLRRLKIDNLPGLPAKKQAVYRMPLTVEESAAMDEVTKVARSAGRQGAVLGALQGLMKLSDHIAVYRGVMNLDNPKELISASPKIQKLVDILARVQKRNEKALVFARLIDTQNILRAVLEHEFDIKVEIVNGKGGSSIDRRRAAISRFREQDGFGVIVLSQEVAGVGLTITEANHVVHFGRWWNPAKEDQATDRVYRIGQEREVQVHVLLSETGDGTTKSFDQNLHELLEQKRQLARDFLTPQDSLEVSQDEILKRMASA